MFRFGTIVLITFPFTDLTSQKVRPAVIISTESPKNGDIIVAFITSKTQKDGLSIKSTDKYFKDTGLKVDSTIRFDKIATLSKKIIMGELGNLDPQFLKKNKNKFEQNFGFYA